MNLTKKERYNLSKQDSVNYMDRRKLLLDEIRNEYKKISRKKYSLGKQLEINPHSRLCFAER